MSTDTKELKNDKELSAKDKKFEDELKKLQTTTSVQTLILSKSRFGSIEQATKWVTSHGFKAEKVDETDTSYRFRQQEPSAFEPNSFRTINITDGVTAVIGKPVAKKAEDEIENQPAESGDKKFHFVADLNAIQFEEESKSTKVQIMRTIEGHKHPAFGEITITKDDIKQFKDNFDNGIRGKELPVDYFHENNKEAAGWIKELEIRNNGEELWAFIEFTPKATEKIQEKEIRFFSPEFMNRFKNKTGEVIKNVLFGGGLTNRPFLDMSPVTFSENFHACFEETIDNKKEEREAEMAEEVKLAEQNADLLNQLSDAKDESKKLSEQVETLETEKKELSESLESIKVEKEAQAFESVFNTLLDEGKVTPALKESYAKKFSATELEELGKSLPKVVSDKAVGSDSTETVELSDAEKAVLEEGIYSREDIIKFRNN